MATGSTLRGNRRNPDRFRRLMAILVLALVISGPAAGGPEHELRRDVVTVIKNQMNAFLRDDGPAAFSFASPDVQEQFGTPEAYLKRFAVTYRPVYRPKTVTFLNLAYSRGKLVQRVLLEDPDGRVLIALFPMLQMDDGSWRIDGLVLIPASGKSATTDTELPVPPDPE